MCTSAYWIDRNHVDRKRNRPKPTKYASICYWGSVECVVFLLMDFLLQQSEMWVGVGVSMLATPLWMNRWHLCGLRRVCLKNGANGATYALGHIHWAFSSLSSQGPYRSNSCEDTPKCPFGRPSDLGGTIATQTKHIVENWTVFFDHGLQRASGAP